MLLDFDDILELRDIIDQINLRINRLKSIRSKVESDKFKLMETINTINDEINQYNKKLKEYSIVNNEIKASIGINQEGSYFLRYVKQCSKCDFTYTKKKELMVHNYQKHSY